MKDKMSRIANTQIGIRVPQDLKEWVQEQAEADRRPMSNWIVAILERTRQAARTKKARL